MFIKKTYNNIKVREKPIHLLILLKIIIEENINIMMRKNTIQEIIVDMMIDKKTILNKMIDKKKIIGKRINMIIETEILEKADLEKELTINIALNQRNPCPILVNNNHNQNKIKAKSLEDTLN